MTRCPVCTSPPWARRSSSEGIRDALSAVLRIGPAAPACACAARKRPDAAAPIDGSAVLACASTPASSASASSVEKVPRPSADPICSVRSPKRTAVTGCRGTRSSCDPVKSTRLSRCELSGRMTASQAGPSRPRPSAVRSMSRQAMPARPPSRGCAYEISGRIHSMRSPSPNARKNGDDRAAGCTAEQTSCWKPGRVSCAVRVPPPRVVAASMTRTAYPALASATAARVRWVRCRRPSPVPPCAHPCTEPGWVRAPIDTSDGAGVLAACEGSQSSTSSGSAVAQLGEPHPGVAVRRRPPVSAGRERAGGGHLRPVRDRRALELREREVAAQEHLQPLRDGGQVVGVVVVRRGIPAARLRHPCRPTRARRDTRSSTAGTRTAARGRG